MSNYKKLNNANERKEVVGRNGNFEFLVIWEKLVC